MSTKEKVLNIIKKSKGISASTIGKMLSISRQAVHKHINKLINDNLIKKIGNTSATKYFMISEKTNLEKFSKIYVNKNLDEDKIFNESILSTNLKRYITNNTYSIINYGFTEILNNAIDHSYSKKIRIELLKENNHITFIIKDVGIGIFYSILKKFSLNSEEDALFELTKGKTTTMPSKHSGEGIFFTSKLCDSMIIRSHSIELIYDNINNDIYTKKNKYLKGTYIEFKLKRSTNRNINNIFNKYASDEYDFKFSKTKIDLVLLQEDYISRSQAKRLLIGLDKFKKIILNFKNVKNIGQGFIDEIYRVFRNKYPNIKIDSINTNSLIESMIKHVRVDKGKQKKLTTG